MVNPNVYVLGGKPDLSLTPTDQNGDFFTPTAMRLSIKEPDGDFITFSGEDLVLASGYYFYRYHPETIGWYEYEGWVRDSEGREITETKGFEIIDRAY